MTFPTSIAAVQYTALSVSKLPLPSDYSQATLFSRFAQFAGGFYVTLENVRDLPAVGTPANVVKVPSYGQRSTSSVGAQPDAADLEVVVNYTPIQWLDTGEPFSGEYTVIGAMVGDGVSRLFQLAMTTSLPPFQDARPEGLGAVPNALFYFVGRIESVVVQPALDDAATATISISLQSDFIGPLTVT